MNAFKMLENIRKHFLNVLNFDIDFNIISIIILNVQNENVHGWTKFSNGCRLILIFGKISIIRNTTGIVLEEARACRGLAEHANAC